jgi:secreted trypsin-like serine protease
MAGKDTCEGDSGGPLIGLAASRLNYELVGITYRAFYDCANPSYPGELGCNPVLTLFLYTMCLDNHPLTLKSNHEKYYLGKNPVSCIPSLTIFSGESSKN